MNERQAGDMIHVALERLELILRWVYPGLLFWLVIPLAIPGTKIGPGGKDFWALYQNLDPWVHLAIILASGTIIYLAERLVLDEIALWLLFAIGIGQARVFRDDQEWYPSASARELWHRFGVMPRNAESAEGRFSLYLINRWAWVHALGSTWLVGLILYLAGFLRWPWYWQLLYVFILLVLVIVWWLQIYILARTEQFFFQGRQQQPPSLGNP